MRLQQFTIVVLLFFIMLLSAPFAMAGRSRKPLSPLQIRILPERTGLTADQIQPGDVVGFKVTAVSAIDAPKLVIDVELTGGAKLVSGDTSWSGSVAKNEEMSIVLTVQTPRAGKGRIRARAVILPSEGDARFSANALYILGPPEKTMPAVDHSVKKDSKGRNIIEYR